MNSRPVAVARMLCRSAVLVLAAAMCSRIALAAELPLLTEGPPTVDTPWAAPGEHVRTSRRSRAVHVNPALSRINGAAVGDELIIPLFDGQVLRSRVDRVSANVLGTVTIRARLQDSPLGCAIISTTNGRSLGTIELPEQARAFRLIGSEGSDVHALFEVSGTDHDVLEGAPSLIPPVEPAARGQVVPFALGPSDPAAIRVMIVYTPAAAAWAVSSGGIANVISQAMAKAQLALDNSSIIASMNLVYSAEVSYTESATSSTDLNRLTSVSDGHMDVVHTWRSAYGADLVCLFTRVEDVGGIGWLLNSSGGSPSYGFSISRVQQAAWTYTTIHEMGHNMGCHHHKEQNVQPGPGLFNYSAGWRWTGTNNGKYCSVMTYEGGQYFADGVAHTRVGYFSSPSISYMGVPTGHATDGDNARTLREIKHVIAAYRVDNSVPATPTLVSPASGAQVATTPTLTASAFSDPEGHAHAASQWQVDDGSAFTSPEWDSGEAYPATTQTTVPEGVLAYDKTYYWRVRYKDSVGAWSAWSASRYFMTPPNNLPTTPTLLSPAAGAVGVSVTTMLSASPFSDPDGDTHSGSQWQVDNDPAFASPEWDSGTATPGATQVSVPAGHLAFKTTYAWRVRYRDGRGGWSGWSSPRQFTTGIDADFNDDGDVDQEDFGRLQACIGPMGVPAGPACQLQRLDLDGDVDFDDVGLFLACMSGSGLPAGEACAWAPPG